MLNSARGDGEPASNEELEREFRDFAPPVDGQQLEGMEGPDRFLNRSLQKKNILTSL